MKKFRELFIGDRSFYKKMLLVAVPIIAQNGITNFVNLLDNIMVGRIGTEQMSGVAIVNQLILIFNVCMLGCVAGAGLFGAQFYGKGDFDGVRHAFRFKLLSCGTLLIFWVLTLYLFCKPFIHMFLHGGSGAGDLDSAYRYGREYLMIILIGLLPSALTQAYAGTLRECGETLLPMKAGAVAVVTNLILDYALIFGAGAIPALGVAGAAIATDIARFAECAIVVVWTHRHKQRNQFIIGAYRSMRIPSGLAKRIFLKGMPLFLNETMWALGMAALTQSYSTRGLTAVAALNISTTVSNLFNVVFVSFGSAIGIVVGQLLGAGKMEEAVDTDRKMIFFSVTCCLLIGSAMFILAPYFPRIYNTTEKARQTAAGLIRVSSALMPFYAFIHAAYFTLRAGGKTMIAFLFDSAYIWALDIPLAFALTRFTGMDVLWIYLCCQGMELFKALIGFVFVKKKIWAQNMTEAG